jgi:hypothetical protein
MLHFGALRIVPQVVQPTVSVLVSVGSFICFAGVRDAAQIASQESHKMDAHLLRFLLQHPTQRESLPLLSEMECWRRGSDLNRRMEVLQTSPLGLLGTAPSPRSIAKPAATCQVSRATEKTAHGLKFGWRRMALTRWRGYQAGVAQEARGFLRGRGTNIEPRAPLESGHLGELGHDLDMPVVMFVSLFADR